MLKSDSLLKVAGTTSATVYAAIHPASWYFLFPFHLMIMLKIMREEVDVVCERKKPITEVVVQKEITSSRANVRCARLTLKRLFYLYLSYYPSRRSIIFTLIDV